MAISTTITQYIGNIDIKYPVAGQDNNSQGFRSNFGNIQAALTATYAVVADLDDRVQQLGNQVSSVSARDILANYVTGTYVVQALGELIVGTTNVVTVGDNFYTRVSMDGAGAGGIKAAGNVALLHNTVAHTVVSYPELGSPGALYSPTVIFNSVVGILPGATFSINSNPYSVVSVNSAGNSITVSGSGITNADANAQGTGVSITFSNPFPAGQYDVQTSIHNLENQIGGVSGSLGTMSQQNSNNVNITGGYVSSASSVVNTGGWNIIPNGNSLYFSFDGTNVARLDSTGAFYALGDVTAGQTGL